MITNFKAENYQEAIEKAKNEISRITSQGSKKAYFDGVSYICTYHTDDGAIITLVSWTIN